MSKREGWKSFEILKTLWKNILWRGGSWLNTRCQKLLCMREFNVPLFSSFILDIKHHITTELCHYVYKIIPNIVSYMWIIWIKPVFYTNIFLCIIFVFCGCMYIYVYIFFILWGSSLLYFYFLSLQKSSIRCTWFLYIYMHIPFHFYIFQYKLLLFYSWIFRGKCVFFPFLMNTRQGFWKYAVVFFIRHVPHISFWT